MGMGRTFLRLVFAVFNYMYMSVSVCVCTSNCSAYRDKERVLGLLELEVRGL